MNIIEETVKAVNQLYVVPQLLVVVACVVVGYVLKLWPQFDNRAIPTAVVLLGALFNMLLADAKPVEVLLRVWVAKHVLVGLVLGFAAWAAHNKLLAKIEDNIPFLGRLLKDKNLAGTEGPQNGDQPGVGEETKK